MFVQRRADGGYVTLLYAPEVQVKDHNEIVNTHNAEGITASDGEREKYLSNVTNNRYFLLIFTSFSEHTKVKHPTRTIIKFDNNICIVNYIWNLNK